MRALALVALVSTLASAQPTSFSLNVTTSGRWLEATPVSAGRTHVKLEGGDLTLGATLEVVRRLSVLRLGAQAGADVMLSPREVNVLRSAPLRPAETSDDSVRSLLFFNVSPFAGVGTTGDGPLAGWVDLLLSLELLTARIEAERHFAFAAVPTVRLGCAFQAEGFAFELSVLGSFFGAQRLTLALGFRI